MIKDIEKIIQEFKGLCDKGTKEDYEYITLQAESDIVGFLRKVFKE